MLNIYNRPAAFIQLALALSSAVTLVSCVTPPTRRSSGVSACIANTNHIEPAKSTWHFERGNTNGATPAGALEQKKRAPAAEQPDWTALHQLLGKPITAKPVVDFVHTHELRKAAKGTSGSFTAPQQAYSVMFDRDRVRTIGSRFLPGRRVMARRIGLPTTSRCLSASHLAMAAKQSNENLAPRLMPAATNGGTAN